jgi:type II secretory pathway pseudopilin PulG
MMSRLRGEGGFSLVPAIATLGLLIMLGGVAVQEAVQSLAGTRDNELRKRALQTADAAIDAAVYQLNRADLGGGLDIDPFDPGTVVNQTCLISTGTVGGTDLGTMPGGILPDAEGRRWCPATTPEKSPEGATWSFRVSEVVRVGAEDCAGDGVLSLDREIVAVAKAGASVRRIRARLRSSVALLSGAAVQSASATAPLQMAGLARVLGDVASNHDIVGVAANVVQGNAIPGPGHAVSGVIPTGTSRSACSKFVLPEIEPGESATSNHNAAMEKDCITAGIAATPCKPLLSPSATGGVNSPTSTSFANSSSSKPVLHVWGNGRATLTGTTYSFCSIRLESQGTLLIRSSTPVTRIFLRDPDDCEGVPNAGQIVVDGSARIINCHGSANPESLQLYALGDDDRATTQTLAGAGLLSSIATATACGGDPGITGWPMVIYAPLSRVEIGGSTAIAGQVAGNTVSMSGSAVVQPVNALVNLNRLGARPVLPLYHPVDYVECTGRTFEQLAVESPNDPSQGC